MRQKIIYSLIILVVIIVSVSGFFYHRENLKNLKSMATSTYHPVETLMWTKSLGSPLYSSGSCGKKRQCSTIFQYIKHINKPQKNKNRDESTSFPGAVEKIGGGGCTLRVIYKPCY